MKNDFKCSQQDGVLVLNKPSGLGSTTCITKIKRQLGQKKIGHAGTLDPMASGVLLVLLGQATKLSGHLQAEGEKLYAGTVKLGETTDTWDAEGKIIFTSDPSHVTNKMIHESIAALVGESEQEVPPYSAAKHKGQPLYALARKGLETPVKIKTIKVSRADVEWVNLPFFRFRVACGSGTYIRSLAHSLGKRLGCGAILTELVREYSYPFKLEEAHDLEEVLSSPEQLEKRIVSIPNTLPDWPVLKLNFEEANLVRNGAKLAHHEALYSHEFVAGINAVMNDEEEKPLALAVSSFDMGRAVWSIVRGLWN